MCPRVSLLVLLTLTLSMLHGFRHSAQEVEKRRKRSTDTYEVTVAASTSHHSIDQKFLSIGLGARLCTRLHAFRTDDPKLQNLAKALAPAGGRIGGTYGGFIIFTPAEGEAVPADVIKDWEDRFGKKFSDKVGKKNFINKYCTGDTFEKMAQFWNTVGWDLSLQMNHLLRKNGEWEPTNARLLLRHLKSKGINLHDCQLTNEVNSYGIKFSGYTVAESQVAADFAKLRTVLDEEGFSSTRILGPDTTSLTKSWSVSYMDNALASKLGDSLDAITFHHFFMNKKEATAALFTDPARSDYGKTMMQNMNSLKSKHSLSHPVYVTETASASGGGKKGFSDRHAGAMSWIDSLGLVALHGGSRLNRQTFWSGWYGLIGFRDYRPTPSYWTSVPFKRLIEGGVLNATVAPSHDKLRVYANCARTNGTMYGAVAGDIVLYYVNLDDKAATVTLPDYADKTYNLFLFSPASNIKDQNVYLNGAADPLAMNGNDLPDLTPSTQTGGSITVAPFGIGYIHVKDAQAPACLSS